MAASILSKNNYEKDKTHSLYNNDTFELWSIWKKRNGW